jgi:tRNA(Ile)-lysidine synthase
MRAWAPAPVWPEGRGVSLARPLLNARREDLRAALRARSADWIDDPANANTDFARVRARARLAEMARLGFDPLRLAALADQCAPHVAALDRAAAALIDTAVRFDADRALIDPAAWVAGAAVRARALGVLLPAPAGATNHARADQVAALAAFWQAPGYKAATVGGGVAARRGGVIELKRDSGALAGRADGASALAPLALPAGRETVWDGRLALTSAEPGWSVVVEGVAPTLVCGKARAAIDAAQPRWLLNERVAHLLAA